MYTWNEIPSFRGKKSLLARKAIDFKWCTRGKCRGWSKFVVNINCTELWLRFLCISFIMCALTFYKIIVIVYEYFLYTRQIYYSRHRSSNLLFLQYNNNLDKNFVRVTLSMIDYKRSTTLNSNLHRNCNVAINKEENTVKRYNPNI